MRGTVGDDGGMPGFADYVGDPVQKTGFHALDGVDLFNLMVIPADRGADRGDAAAALGAGEHLLRGAPRLPDGRRAGRLDGHAGAAGRWCRTASDVDALRATVVKDHSAVFYPDVVVNDRGMLRTMGPAGSIAGLMARTDATRGVWKAPAGTEADVRGIVGLATSTHRPGERRPEQAGRELPPELSQPAS